MGALLDEQNGQGGARQSLGGLPHVVDTIAALRQLGQTDLFGVVFLSGAITVGDGSGGSYYWNAADSSADNGTTIIRPAIILAGNPGRWNLLGSNSSVIATGSTTSRSLANRFADIVNVKDFGAMGDGVTDDSAAFIAALAFAVTNGGGTVYAPAATYRINSSLLIQTGKVRLIGAGCGEASILDFTNLGSGSCLELASGVYTNNVEISGFKILGTAAVNGIYLHGTSSGVAVVDCAFRDLTIANCLTGIKSSYAFCNHFENIRTSSCTTGLDAGAQTNNSDYIRCSFTGGTRNIKCVNAGGLYFGSCNINNTVGAGAAVTLSQSQIILANPYFEGITSSILATLGIGSEAPPNNSSLIISGGYCNVTDPTIALNSYGAYLECSGMNVEAGIPVITNNFVGGATYYLKQCRWLFADQATQPLGSNITTWRGERPSPYPKGGGGGGILTTAIRPSSSMMRTDTPNRGPVISSALVIGQPYTLVYAMRVTGTAVNLTSVGSRALQVQAASEDLELRYMPFIADATTVILTFDTANVDVEIAYLAIIKGTAFPEIDLSVPCALFANAAPISGTWSIGGQVFQATPVVGQPKSWRCTLAGTPGTWVSEGDL